MALMALVIVPTAAMALTWPVLGFLRLALNVDFLLLYLASVAWARWIGWRTTALALAGVMFIVFMQILRGAGVTFLYDLSLLSDYLAFARYWPWPLIGLGAGATLTLAVAGYLLMRQIAFARAKLSVGFALLALVVLANFLSHTPAGFAALKGDWVTSSAYLAFRLGKDIGAPRVFTAELHPGPTMLRLVSAGPPPPRILSVSVEAWGHANDSDLRAQIPSRLLALVGRDYEISQSTHIFRGLTIAGELRELCGIRIGMMPQIEDARRIAPGCLPRQLTAAGYRTMAMHGNTGFFYMRNNLYREIGFQRSVFANELVKDGAELCPHRAFPGVCDRDVLARALSSFGDSPQEFVHVMTLNTHLPLSAPEPGDAACLKRPDTGLCIYGKRIADTLSALGEALATSRVKPDVVYVYGDHAPPFLLATERNAFSADQAPFLVLTRRRL